MFVTAGGLILGAGIASLLSITLVDVLTGVFDPPPDVSASLAVSPSLSVAVVAAVLAAGWLTLHSLRRPTVDELRDL